MGSPHVYRQVIKTNKSGPIFASLIIALVQKNHTLSLHFTFYVVHDKMVTPTVYAILWVKKILSGKLD